MKASGGLPLDALVLTKPLGTGLIATAIKRQTATQDESERTVTSMLQLNASAAKAMRAAGAEAATDVTGFGFLGHLIGMCELSGLEAEIEAGSIPILEGAIDKAAAGMVPGGTRRNRDHFANQVVFSDDISDDLRTVLFDAQTSGGLLIAISLDRLPRLLAALEEESASASVVGRLTEGTPGAVRVS